MACLIVPAAEAIVITVVTKVVESKEKKAESLSAGVDCGHFKNDMRISFAKKLKWLSNILFGGSALLAFEHLWHGEIVPWFPFLTTAASPQDFSRMLHEMSTVGVSMAVFVTAIWGMMLVVANAMEKKTIIAQTAAK